MVAFFVLCVSKCVHACACVRDRISLWQIQVHSMSVWFRGEMVDKYLIICCNPFPSNHMVEHTTMDNCFDMDI